MAKNPIYLVLDASSARDAIDLAGRSGAAVWMGSDAMSDEMHRHCVDAGLEVSWFTYPLGAATSEEIEGALSTIEEHHPDALIWIQHVRKA